MRRTTAVAVALAVAAVAAVAAGSLASARSSPSKAKPLPGLPAYTAGYKSWPKLNRRPIPERRSGDAHGGTKNVYASKRIRNGRYPVGTIVVKESFRTGTSFRQIVAVMRKVKGFDRRHNDWQMIEWARESRTARFTEVARDDVCYSCHVGAKKNDYVFTKR